jgi:hypothetical protein
VFAVPKSIATSGANSPPKIPISPVYLPAISRTEVWLILSECPIYHR